MPTISEAVRMAKDVWSSEKVCQTEIQTPEDAMRYEPEYRILMTEAEIREALPSVPYIWTPSSAA